MAAHAVGQFQRRLPFLPAHSHGGESLEGQRVRRTASQELLVDRDRRLDVPGLDQAVRAGLQIIRFERSRQAIVGLGLDRSRHPRQAPRRHQRGRSILGEPAEMVAGRLQGGRIPMPAVGGRRPAQRIEAGGEPCDAGQRRRDGHGRRDADHPRPSIVARRTARCRGGRWLGRCGWGRLGHVPAPMSERKRRCSLDDIIAGSAAPDGRFARHARDCPPGPGLGVCPGRLRDRS